MSQVLMTFNILNGHCSLWSHTLAQADGDKIHVHYQERAPARPAGKSAEDAEDAEDKPSQLGVQEGPQDPREPRPLSLTPGPSVPSAFSSGKSKQSLSHPCHRTVQETVSQVSSNAP
jgi:hypothetical protein